MLRGGHRLAQDGAPSGERASRSRLLSVPVILAVLAFGCTRAAFDASRLSAEAVLGPVPVPADNPQTAEKVELGRLLFFDKRLSGPNTTSCASCHDPAKGWSDGLARCAGCERNTISLFNIAYEDRPAWDGFAASLEEHNAAAITFDQDASELVGELSAVADYRDRFAAVFGGEITFADVTRALGAFERSVLTFSSPFDRYQAGDRHALTARQREGLGLFNGKADCSSCHIPPLFIDNGFHALGVSLTDDPGRFAVTGDERDRGAFRTPTLRNVALSAPYMHDGSLPTLADVVAFYDAGGGTVRGRTSPGIRPLHLSERERQALVAFLESLTDATTDTRTPSVTPAP